MFSFSFNKIKDYILFIITLFILYFDVMCLIYVPLIGNVAVTTMWTL